MGEKKASSEIQDFACCESACFRHLGEYCLGFALFCFWGEGGHDVGGLNFVALAGQKLATWTKRPTHRGRSARIKSVSHHAPQLMFPLKLSCPEQAVTSSSMEKSLGELDNRVISTLSGTLGNKFVQ